MGFPRVQRLRLALTRKLGQPPTFLRKRLDRTTGYFPIDTAGTTLLDSAGIWESQSLTLGVASNDFCFCENPIC